MGAAQIVNIERIFLYRRSVLRKWDEFSSLWQKLFTNFVRYLQQVEILGRSNKKPLGN